MKSSVAVRRNLQTGDERELLRSTNRIELRLSALQVALATRHENNAGTLRLFDLTAEPMREQFAVPLPKRSRLGWWALGGRYVLVQTLVGEPAEFQVQLETINCERGTITKTDLSLRGLDIAGVRSDGKQIYIRAASEPLNEVWVMENFLPQVAAAKK